MEDPTKMKKSKRNVQVFPEANLQYFPTGKSRLESSKRSIFAAQKTDSNGRVQVVLCNKRS